MFFTFSAEKCGFPHVRQSGFADRVGRYLLLLSGLIMPTSAARGVCESMCTGFSNCGIVGGLIIFLFQRWKHFSYQHKVSFDANLIHPFV